MSSELESWRRCTAGLRVLSTEDTSAETQHGYHCLLKEINRLKFPIDGLQRTVSLQASRPNYARTSNE